MSEFDWNAAASQLASTALQAGASWASSTFSKKATKELMDKQQQIDQQNFLYQLQHNDEYSRRMTQWAYDNYESPTARRNALMAAGYSPELALSSSSSGASIAGGSSTGQMASGSAPAAPQVDFASAIKSAFQMNIYRKQLANETKVSDAKAAADDAVAGYYRAKEDEIRGDTKQSQANLKLTEQQIENFKKLNIGQDSINRLNEVAANIAEATEDISILDSEAAFYERIANINVLEQTAYNLFQKGRALSVEADAAEKYGLETAYQELRSLRAQATIDECFSRYYSELVEAGWSSLEIANLRESVVAAILDNDLTAIENFGSVAPANNLRAGGRSNYETDTVPYRTFQDKIAELRKIEGDINFQSTRAYRLWNAAGSLVSGATTAAIMYYGHVNASAIRGRAAVSAAATRANRK